MAYKRKTWLHNLWEALLMIIVGIPVGYLGLTWFNGMQESGTSGGMVINGIPLPLELLPILLMAGFILALYGLVIILTTLFLRIFKKRKSYNDQFWVES